MKKFVVLLAFYKVHFAEANLALEERIEKKRYPNDIISTNLPGYYNTQKFH